MNYEFGIEYVRNENNFSLSIKMCFKDPIHRLYH
jgi:hypothetical protein